MAEAPALNPTEYIQHHLTFLAAPVREGGGFWTLHWDTLSRRSCSASSRSASCGS